MENITFKASIRTETGKGAARRLRAEKLIPAVLYGRAAEQSLSLSLDPKALRQIITSSARRLNTLLSLDLSDGKEHLVLVKDYQLDTLSHDLVHVDLIQVKADEQVTVRVPLAFVGTSPAIKDGGSFQALRRELEVQVLPLKIPSSIDIDVSNLMMGENIHLLDIELPEGVSVKSAVNFTICAMVAPEVDEKRGGAEAAAPAGKGGKK
ncbi:MAG: 50S ribosomal protein L25 [Myxococcales bacterium]|jgi:large subunit ribosomal protein L25|nr:50S ribosomal protein L25 [Myxococcales bacterium]